MRKISFLFIFLCLPVSATLAVPASAAQRHDEKATAGQASLITVEATLLKGIDAVGSKPGDLFLVRTRTDWRSGDCLVPAGTLVNGHVAAVQTAPRHVEWALSFEPVPCRNNESGSRVPLLIALDNDRVVPTGGLSRMSTAGAEEQAIQTMFSPPRPGLPQGGPVTDSPLPVYNTYAGLQAVNEDAFKTGEVRSLRGVHMVLPGTSASTGLVADRANISLYKYAIFLLTLAPPGVTPVRHEQRLDELATATAPASAAKPAAAPPEPPEAAEVCAAGSCAVLATSAPSAPLPASSAAWTVDLRQLGLYSQPDQMVAGLKHTASILPLGDGELIVTFDTHGLRRRDDNIYGSEGGSRDVRAVLLHARDGSLAGVHTWTASDDLDAPVWPLGDGTVLAHVGHDLVDYSNDLHEVRRMTPPGPVVFVDASPSGELLLLATIHERHTHAEHARLASFLGPGQLIDEQYDLTGLRRDLQPVGSQQLDSEPLRPAMLADGLVSETRVKTNLWQLQLTPWGDPAQTLGRLHSGCEPLVTSLPANRLLVRGCDRNSAELTWFKVIDRQGRSLLKGTIGFGDVLQQVATTHDGSLFATAVTHFDQAVRRGDQRPLSAFRQLSLRVYSTATGKLVFNTELSPGSAEAQTFSFAPDAHSLVVLTGSVVRSFELPPVKPAI